MFLCQNKENMKIGFDNEKYQKNKRTKIICTYVLMSK